jgi:hypothetical protein
MKYLEFRHQSEQQQQFAKKTKINYDEALDQKLKLFA